jgi:hypothetical protein
VNQTIALLLALLYLKMDYQYLDVARMGLKSSMGLVVSWLARRVTLCPVSSQIVTLEIFSLEMSRARQIHAL